MENVTLVWNDDNVSEERAVRVMRWAGLTVTRAMRAERRKRRAAALAAVGGQDALPAEIQEVLRGKRDALLQRGHYFLYRLLANGGWSLAKLKGKALRWRAKYAERRDRLVSTLDCEMPEGWSVERKLVGGKSHLVVCGQGLTAVWS
jgi:hypothetical protein